MTVRLAFMAANVPFPAHTVAVALLATQDYWFAAVDWS